MTTPEYRLKNREKINAYAREYAKKHRKELNVKAMEYYYSHHEQCIANITKWNKENKHKINKRRRERYILEPEFRGKKLASANAWHIAHPNAGKEYYQKNKKHHSEIVMKYHREHVDLIRKIRRDYNKRHAFEVACYQQLLRLSR
jgi:chromosome condensin MukBEF ATPase and DNA-binding subunit MukB